MAKLKDKVAFLTGAGAGIAKATAKLFVAEGAKVAIIEMNREVGDAAEKEIRAAGGDALFIETDVTKKHISPIVINVAVRLLIIFLFVSFVIYKGNKSSSLPFTR